MVPERTAWNRIYIQESLEQAYEKCFGQALMEYNAGQKRKDRRKENYLKEIENSGNKEKTFYENIVQIGRQREQVDSARKQETDLDGIGIPEILNLPDVNVTRVGESMTDITDKNEFVGTRENESVDKTDWIVRRISEFGGYENVSDSVKADIFGFDIADVSGSIRLFSDVMKRLGIKKDGDEMYEEFQKIYDESVGRGAGKDKMWNRGRGR